MIKVEVVKKLFLKKTAYSREYPSVDKQNALKIRKREHETPRFKKKHNNNALEITTPQYLTKNLKHQILIFAYNTTIIHISIIDTASPLLDSLLGYKATQNFLSSQQFTKNLVRVK